LGDSLIKEMKMRLLGNILCCGLLLVGVSACSEITQQADPDFIPQNKHKSFSGKESPVVFVDEAHNNFLRISDRYSAFAQVLKSDGYTVKSGKKNFSLKYLEQADILVVANALEQERRDWTPPYGDAFQNDEVAAVKRWVEQGGALFLVADHTPFPRAIEKLALAFGFEFSNGHVKNAVFRIENNTLARHAITTGIIEDAKQPGQGGKKAPLLTESSELLLPSNAVTRVRAFGGSAFKTPEKAVSLLTLADGVVSIIPDVPFQVTAETPRKMVNGWSQGAVMEFGQGRVAVFAEGMMFSSQLDTKTGKKYGLTSKGAEQNERFLLNVMHWLSGTI